jgi:hypothetical protein
MGFEAESLVKSGQRMIPVSLKRGEVKRKVGSRVGMLSESR